MDVQLREIFREIPTRRLQAASVNPALFGEDFNPFPYTLQDCAEDAPAPERWRAVELENEYLKLVVLPDMGGRVAELYDKLAGRDILVPVHEIKPRMAAHRGAWAAGGLEFNCPASHSPTTMDTVSCLTRRYPDGSASVVFGAIERISFLSWKVELRLYPGLAYVEESVDVCNPTDNWGRYCWWTNAAVPYVRGMRMAYPFDWRTTMEGGYEKWPMDGLYDSSDPASLPESYETSGKLMARDFFGVHYPGLDFGVAHAASRKHVKGAMFFTWGNGELARARNRALMPEGREYIEIQSGPFESQGVLRHLRPHGTAAWKEYWYGVRGIGPFCQATRDAAVAVERGAGAVTLRFSANGRFEDCAVRLTHGDTRQECALSLYPESVAAAEFAGVGPEETLAVDVLCRGKLLLSVGHEAPPMEDMPDFDLFEDSRTSRAEGEYDERPLARGMQHEQYGRLAEAAEAYEENLCNNPGCPVTLARLGRIMLRQLRPAEAADYFERALREDNRCGAARFGLAAAARMSGDCEHARRLYYDIAQDSEMFGASALEAAALNIRLGDPYANLTLLEGADSPYGRFLLEVSCRLVGAEADSPEEPGALEEYFLAERFLALGDGKGLLDFTAGREDQLACLALEYERLGLREDSLAIASLCPGPGMKTALVRALNGEIAVQEALALPLDGVFVNEPALIQLLWDHEDETGQAQWLTGCFQYAAGLRAEAVESWLAAYGAGLRHTALLFSLGHAYYLEGDLEEAHRYLRQDASLHGHANAASLALLFRVLRERGDVFERLELLPLLQETRNRPMVAAEIAGTLRDGALPEEALAFLETAQFQNFEGAETSGLIWSGVVGELALKHAEEGRADGARALASRMFDYPDGLHYGRRPGQSQAEHLHTLGRVYRLTGDVDKSREAFRQGAQEGANRTVRKDDEAMRWVRMCQDELRA